MKTMICLTSLLIVFSNCYARNIDSESTLYEESSSKQIQNSAQALIERIIPQKSNQFICEIIPAVQGKEVYEIESQNGKIILRGNNGVALASAFYHYLKEYCRCHISWNGDNLNLPKSWPVVNKKIRVESPFKHKFAYNYCTHGYSMAFWGWQEWERELDWLALHGINMALIIQGQEAVWQNTFARFNYTKEEIRQWICSPVHQPWQYMQNMEAIFPPSQNFIDQRVILGKKIIQRCRELGINPVLQGFYGMIPYKFKEKFPDAQIVEQGGWAGQNHRPDMLHIKDPRFTVIAKAFLEEQKKLFGECQYFAADPFHEGGRTGNMKRGDVFKVIQDVMLDFNPDSVLVKQCWQTSNKEMFDAGNKKQTLALDLFCDYRPFWNRCDGYSGTPWLWSLLANFGGNTAMEANLPKLVKDFGNVVNDKGRGKLSGFALVPEGTQHNPVLYELMTEMGWRGAPTDLNKWIQNYIFSRYGKTDVHASKAWDIMLKTNYQLTTGEAPLNTVIAARPRIDGNIRARHYSPGSNLRYDNQFFSQAWKELILAAPQLKNSDAFRFDLADCARQTLCNLSRPVYDQMIQAYKTKNISQFNLQSSRLLQIIRDLELLTQTRTDWLMGKWVQQAKKWGTENVEKKYFDHCSKLLLTTWVVNPNTDLADYANRIWSGLLEQYYLPRWEMFIQALENDLKGVEKYDPKKFKDKCADFEKQWIQTESTMIALPKGDTILVASSLYQKYEPILADFAPKPGRLDGPQWKSNDLLHSQIFFWDVSSQVKSPGIYALTFQWKSGQSALSIESVSILVNDNIVHTDEHPGWTGTENRHNTFYLKTVSVPPNAKVEIKISGMKGASGTDSNGILKLEKLK